MFHLKKGILVRRNWCRSLWCPFRWKHFCRKTLRHWYFSLEVLAVLLLPSLPVLFCLIWCCPFAVDTVAWSIIFWKHCPARTFSIVHLPELTRWEQFLTKIKLLSLMTFIAFWPACCHHLQSLTCSLFEVAEKVSMYSLCLTWIFLLLYGGSTLDDFMSTCSCKESPGWEPRTRRIRIIWKKENSDRKREGEKENWQAFA